MAEENFRGAGGKASAQKRRGIKVAKIPAPVMGGAAGELRRIGFKIGLLPVRSLREGGGDDSRLLGRHPVGQIILPRKKPDPRGGHQLLIYGPVRCLFHPVGHGQAARKIAVQPKNRPPDRFIPDGKTKNAQPPERLLRGDGFFGPDHSKYGKIPTARPAAAGRGSPGPICRPSTCPSPLSYLLH